jgi:LCP family protein required for cell wall assembly
MIDFKEGLDEDDHIEELIKEGKSARYPWLKYLIVVGIIGLVFAGRIIISSQGADSWFGANSFFGKVAHLATNSGIALKGEENDRINILLIGMGGDGHDGAYLADTIMLISIKPSTKQIAMISVPRDMIVPIDGYGWAKVNAVNAVAEAKQKNSGGPAMTQALSTILGTPIDYYVRVDFQGFVNIINDLGGVTVNVENTLDDYSYPIIGQEDNPNYNARYEHLHVDKGLQTMDGNLALAFARSRHGVGIEGSDFARAKRQQLILQAVKEKLLSSSTLLQPATIAKIIAEVQSHFDTNLNIREMIALFDNYKNVDQSKIIDKVIDNSPNGLLVAGNGKDGAYILTPVDGYGNFSGIQNMVQNIFTDNAPKEVISPLTDTSKIQIINGTWISGLASKIADALTPYNFETINVNNGVNRTQTNSVIYDTSYGRNNQALTTLEKLTGATQSFDNPSWLSTVISATNTPDFILLLGTDANRWQISPIK